ncbi:MAG: hypothetical protein OXI01_08405 [Albidovulum sp.]|nr:hypothetical protein [Albidovulum sp.]
MIASRACELALPLALTQFVKAAAMGAIFVNFAGGAQSSLSPVPIFRTLDRSITQYFSARTESSPTATEEKGVRQARAALPTGAREGLSATAPSDSGAVPISIENDSRPRGNSRFFDANPLFDMESAAIVLFADASAANSVFSFAPPFKPREVQARGVAMQSWPRSISPLKRPPGLGFPKLSSNSTGKPPTSEALELVRYQATERQAMDTDRVNLIGVFGTNEKRKALVRFKNGSIRKLTINSKLLGGRVVSIGDNSVTIVKEGRTYRLNMEN